MKIGLCQFSVTGDKSQNIERAVQAIGEAAGQGAQIIVLPEMFNCPYDNQYFRAYGETEDGPTLGHLQALVKDLGIVLVAGSIPELEGDKVYNTAYVIDRDGRLVGKHRKAHLFDIDIPGGISFTESKTLTAGERATVVETSLGKIGVAICYDMRFPEIFRDMVLGGADLICIPAAFNMTTGPAHWHLTARARALDNQAYMALCSPARVEEAGYVAYGHSLVANPWGEVVGECGHEDQVLVVDLDWTLLKKTREGLPLLKHRRPEIYG